MGFERMRAERLMGRWFERMGLGERSFDRMGLAEGFSLLML